ncbi:MAG: hypothetical protein VKQ33_01175, partial [Candidatus Sericytochromatia bacterium]|nr:hypothetical protein [Candidatus Sericytochromatia bacterium]
MAPEFRKREDISKELDLLQQWSELGAPRMGELEPSIRRLVRTVEPPAVPTTEAHEGPTVTPAELPPGSVETWTGPILDLSALPPGDEDQPGRLPHLVPLLVGLLLLAGSVAFILSRDPFGWQALEGDGPAEPEAPGGELPRAPAPTAAPTTGPTATPTTAPTAAPTTAPTATPTTAPTATPTTAPTAAPTTAPTAAPTTAPTAAPTTAP